MRPGADASWCDEESIGGGGLGPATLRPDHGASARRAVRGPVWAHATPCR